MTAPLTPTRALAYLRELSVDVRAAVVLDAAGAPIAGDAQLADRARALLRDGSDPLATADGRLLAARSRDGAALAVLAGDFALLPLLEHDLATLAEALVEPPETRDSP